MNVKEMLNFITFALHIALFQTTTLMCEFQRNCNNKTIFIKMQNLEIPLLSRKFMKKVKANKINCVKF